MGLRLIIQRRSYFPPGRDGRNAPEWVAGMDRNRWPESIGISGRNASEYAGMRSTIDFSGYGGFNSCYVIGINFSGCLVAKYKFKIRVRVPGLQ